MHARRFIDWLAIALLPLVICCTLNAAQARAADGPAPCPEETVYRVGVAQIDITPAYPVRLSGFGFRRTESEGVTQPIWAKALAIDDGAEGPALLITIDNLGVPDDLVSELAARLQKSAGLKRERLSVTATHTHTAPMLSGVAPNLFSMAIPADHQARIDRYTRELTDNLEKVAHAALRMSRLHIFPGG
jgi:hypothetical protein